MSKYQDGANFERRVRRSLETQGWYVIRSAGSHGLVDLIAFRQGEVWLMQNKISGTDTRHNKEQLLELANDNGFRAFIVSRGDKHTRYSIIFEELDSALK